MGVEQTELRSLLVSAQISRTKARKKIEITK